MDFSSLLTQRKSLSPPIVSETSSSLTRSELPLQSSSQESTSSSTTQASTSTSSTTYSNPALTNAAEHPETQSLNIRISPRPLAEVQQQDPQLHLDAASTNANDGDQEKSEPEQQEPILSSNQVRRLELGLCTKLREWLRGKRIPGRVYVLHSPSRPDLVKIGMATSPARRARQLRKDCNLSDLVVAHKSVKIDRPDRVEALAHRQLAPFMQEIRCDHGGGPTQVHKEWFRCSVEMVKRVVDAWAAWMKKDPYKRTTLRPQWKNRLEELKGSSEEEVKFAEIFARHKEWMEQAL
ncbi:hypothetical protein DIS24_g5866 [Lasiodiplodia hormozganensis]|uniref:Bacteriophage T5 Orf172 DNA-binding domain-containing protein n=1 Tax=Lasiodiplodia hormozganensis TaxID=869390 RepID=A0AA40CW78_9PEZI|nr:hypothetical protein DIS24_g5866 [Lasiodiplodia hormozganensis]